MIEFNYEPEDIICPLLTDLCLISIQVFQQLELSAYQSLWLSFQVIISSTI